MGQTEGRYRRQRQHDVADSVNHGNVEDRLVFAKETVRYHRPKYWKEIGEHYEGVVDDSCVALAVEEVFCEVQAKHS